MTKQVHVKFTFRSAGILPVVFVDVEEDLPISGSRVVAVFDFEGSFTPFLFLPDIISFSLSYSI